jgi:hypothetical protein
LKSGRHAAATSQLSRSLERSRSASAASSTSGQTSNFMEMLTDIVCAMNAAAPDRHLGLVVRLPILQGRGHRRSGPEATNPMPHLPYGNFGQPLGYILGYAQAVEQLSYQCFSWNKWRRERLLYLSRYAIERKLTSCRPPDGFSKNSANYPMSRQGGNRLPAQ